MKKTLKYSRSIRFQRRLQQGLFLALFLLLSCAENDSDGSNQDTQTTVVFAPDRIPFNGQFPISITKSNSDLTPILVNEEILLEVSRGSITPSMLSLKHGRGGRICSVSDTCDFSLQVDNTSQSYDVSCADTTFTTIDPDDNSLFSGQLITGTYLLQSDLHVPANEVLSFGEGCHVLIAPGVNIIVEGDLELQGSIHSPVLLIPEIPGFPWGGIAVSQGSLVANYAIFLGGGGDSTRVFGHSNSQPVIMIEGGTAEIVECCFMDNLGKALGGSEARILFRKGLITRCDTGGEFYKCEIQVYDSHVIDIPDETQDYVDDDNDGFYFNNILGGSLEGSVVQSTHFVRGKDDAIDHNGAILSIRDCYIEDFEHEGIACSNGQTATIENTLIMECEQGIEAGYGSPQVSVDHCVVLDCDVGLRFGDSYDWGCSGHMSVRNSVLHGNNDNIRNYDLSIDGPLENAIDVQYTLSNDLEYDSSVGCLVGAPVFDDAYILLPESIGYDGADDGESMGRIRP